jgi:hypothetical protein
MSPQATIGAQSIVPRHRGEIYEKKMASIYRSLLRAGFSADIVRRELRSLTREEVPDVELE